MAPARKRARKHFFLDPVKIKRAESLVCATQTETIDRALDLVISEHKNDRLSKEAHDRFLRSGIKIKDVYGVLED